MNILFLTLNTFDSIYEHTIYADLLREFLNNGHKVFTVSPIEERYNKETHVIKEDNSTILRLKIGNIHNVNLIKKGISTVSIGSLYKKGIVKYFQSTRFDLILYSTPPITFVSVIEFIKKRDKARTYLLLKDIFPQNAVDLGMMSTTGLKGLIYKHFRKQEKKLYKVSDRIGCMSPANVNYVIKHNPEVNPTKVEVCPNSIDVIDKSVDEETRKAIREKYGIPLDKTVFVYGGNLGKPQGIPFVIDCLKACKDIEDAYFLIIGSGTEYHLLDEYVRTANQKNLKLMQRLPKEDYDNMVGACDVGLIFLDHRFTIPNFPSRLLSYMQAKLPVLACTDPNTDIGKIISEGGFGWWCESNNIIAYLNCVNAALSRNVKSFASNSYLYLQEHYTAKKGYDILIEGIYK